MVGWIQHFLKFSISIIDLVLKMADGESIPIITPNNFTRMRPKMSNVARLPTVLRPHATGIVFRQKQTRTAGPYVQVRDFANGHGGTCANFVNKRNPGPDRVWWSVRECTWHRPIRAKADAIFTDADVVAWLPKSPALDPVSPG